MLANATTATGARKKAAKNSPGAASSRPGESLARRFMAVHRSGAGAPARRPGAPSCPAAARQAQCRHGAPPPTGRRCPRGSCCGCPH
ncbi:hypothetical protein G6F55_014478 [Rhizopus delemar]|nr:hypothetical protein G6F55_014478 [Rhizopus delemar]